MFKADWSKYLLCYIQENKVLALIILAKWMAKQPYQLYDAIMFVNLTFADEDDLVEVRSALFPIASRWKGVGIELRLKLSDLDTIEGAHPNSPEDCLTDVVSRWLQKGYNTTRHGPPTWRKLVRAILVDSGGHNPGLAEKLAQNHQGVYIMCL